MVTLVCPPRVFLDQHGLLAFGRRKDPPQERFARALTSPTQVHERFGGCGRLERADCSAKLCYTKRVN